MGGLGRKTSAGHRHVHPDQQDRPGPGGEQFIVALAVICVLPVELATKVAVAVVSDDPPFRLSTPRLEVAGSVQERDADGRPDDRESLPDRLGMSGGVRRP
jgi:hypothetical protein